MRKPLGPMGKRLRVVGYCSGSGNSLWKALELQKQLDAGAGAPFEIVGIFCDQPEARCLQTAEQEGLPAVCLDIRAFYAQRGADLRDLEVRKEFDAQALPLVAELRPDLILLAGYVWAVTNVITGTYLTIGIHPGDLTVQENGVRLLAGANGVKAAFRHARPEIRASSFVATDALDGGPILITSPAIPVDYAAHPDEEERFRTYLKLVNAQNRLVAARTLLEVASGAFTTDGTAYYYHDVPAPLGIKFDAWDEDGYVCERDQ